VKLSTFTIDTAMIHDVPRGNNSYEELVLTDDPIELDEDLRSYFVQKIVTSLTEHGVDVESDPNEDETVRAAVAQIISTPSNLPHASRRIAERLNTVQTGVNPAGLLVVATGAIDGKPCASVLKLEREQGLRFRIDTLNGRKTVNLQHLRDLTLTDKTKVFKTSVLQVGGRGRPSAAAVAGRVSDDQRGDFTTGVATFFLGTFLGCRLRDNPEKSTLAFVDATSAFINDEVTDPQRKGRYQVALLATLQDHTVELQPRRFASTHLDAKDRPRFLDRIREAGLDPNVSFPKETRLVKVNGFRWTFESGMVLVGHTDDLDHRVKIRPSDARVPGVDINDTLETLRGR
jgi:hypothetical protein